MKTQMQTDPRTLDISLLGRTYQIACAPGQEVRVQELARMLEEKMRLAVTAAPGNVGEIRLLLLAGLMLADDVLEAKAATTRAGTQLQSQINDEEDVLIAAVEHLSERITALAAKVENA
jgi:cell division protein ZapA